MALYAKVGIKGRLVTYHRIEICEFHYTNEGAAPGAIGSLVVTIRGYEDRDACIAGNGALVSKGYRFSFGPEASETIYGKGGLVVSVPAINSSEPTRGDIYMAVRRLPEFANSVDV